MYTTERNIARKTARSVFLPPSPMSPLLTTSPHLEPTEGDVRSQHEWQASALKLCNIHDTSKK
ncbi:CLUMA_CG003641, isoform A [Clunio marinus]|uniref:CLUMA_CG003641, isoform A n=1 Tax=Clunio marinus TaxID=568069 RepID=A0A1J1HTV0_9DIPT|nr:CLUMA_CG003641, isoform A [Clunio marinus]